MSVGNGTLPTMVTFTASPDPQEWIALEPRSLTSFPAATPEESDELHRRIVALVMGLRVGVHDFPIVNAAELGLKTERDRILWYLSTSRMAGYLTCVRFATACGLDLSNSRMLDIGTGPGVLPFVVRESFPDAETHGWDINEQYLALARALFPEVTFSKRGIAGDARGVSFDHVFCAQTLEHMAFPGRSLRELLGVVRPGGALVVTVPDGRLDTSSAYGLNRTGASYIGHVSFWSIESWASFLQAHCPGSRISVAITERSALYACIRTPRTEGA